MYIEIATIQNTQMKFGKVTLIKFQLKPCDKWTNAFQNGPISN